MVVYGASPKKAVPKRPFGSKFDEKLFVIIQMGGLTIFFHLLHPE
jgi:hypothetical protein